MVREVAQRLHRLAPRPIPELSPACIAIEFLKVVNKRLDQALMARLLVCPDSWGIKNDVSIDDIIIVPCVDDLLRAVDNFHLFVEEAGLDYRACFEFL
jgi:hypothetical protein